MDEQGGGGAAEGSAAVVNAIDDSAAAEVEGGRVVLQEVVNAGGVDRKRVSMSGMGKGDHSPGGKARQQKRRMSMKNRRVSFAPDPELTMIHTFVKEDQSTPEMGGFGGALQGGAQQEEPRALMGDITASLPSLGELAEEEEERERGGNEREEAVAARGVGGYNDYQDHTISNITNPYAGIDNVTAFIPQLGDLLEEDEMLDGGAPMVGQGNGSLLMASPPVQQATVQQPEVQQQLSPLVQPEYGLKAAHSGSSAHDGDDKETGSVAQENKWGFLPGTDDTMDMDLQGHGTFCMSSRDIHEVYRAIML